jgi:hypothetical protein
MRDAPPLQREYEEHIPVFQIQEAFLIWRVAFERNL